MTGNCHSDEKLTSKSITQSLIIMHNSVKFDDASITGDTLVRFPTAQHPNSIRPKSRGWRLIHNYKCPFFTAVRSTVDLTEQYGWTIRLKVYGFEYDHENQTDEHSYECYSSKQPTRMPVESFGIYVKLVVCGLFEFLRIVHADLYLPVV